MGRSSFLAGLLVSSLLLLSFSHGFGRKLMQNVNRGDFPVELAENGGKWRKMVGVMDYSDPEPNTNPRSGFLLSPPPAPRGQD
ncbi:Pectinesterase [Psidium guajava]|nr:Pectinesterase [Psidium guajava]